MHASEIPYKAVGTNPLPVKKIILASALGIVGTCALIGALANSTFPAQRIAMVQQQAPKGR